MVTIYSLFGGNTRLFLQSGCSILCPQQQYMSVQMSQWLPRHFKCPSDRLFHRCFDLHFSEGDWHEASFHRLLAHFMLLHINV